MEKNAITDSDDYRKTHPINGSKLIKHFKDSWSYLKKIAF